MKTTIIKASDGRKLDNSMAEIINVDINNTKQCLLIRGENILNPVILFVHGGPGQAEIGYIKDYQKELEKHFVVVRWDQRGSGLSGSGAIPAESFTVESFVSDAGAVTDYLIKRFNKPKIFISGHSWGTVISTYAIKNNPEKYIAYIGVSQVVDIQEAIKVSYKQTYSIAQKEHNSAMLSKLKRLGEPPYSMKEYMSYSSCMAKTGGFIKTPPKRSMQMSLFLAKEYSFSEKITYFTNMIRYSKLLFAELTNINLYDDINQLEIPVIFIAGKHDGSTPCSLIEKFYTNLKAPKKEFILFEHSAHMPQLEENQRFNETLLQIKNRYTS